MVLANRSRGIRPWRIGRPHGTLRPILPIDLRDLAGVPLQGVTGAAWAGSALFLGNDQGPAYHLPSLRPLLESPADVFGRLDRLSKTAHVLTLHRGAVTSLTPDAPGRRFVTASQDGKIRLCNLSEFRPADSPRKPIELTPEWEIPGHAADLTPDGRLLATADSEAAAVYHAPTGVPLAWNPTRPLGGKVVRLRLGPDGKSLTALVCRCCDCGAPGPFRPVRNPRRRRRGLERILRRNAMRIALAVLAAAGSLATDDCCSQGKANPWKDYNAGVRWETALSPNPDRFSARAAAQASVSSRHSWKTAIEPALARARLEGKLLLFFQLVGDLALEGC